MARMHARKDWAALKAAYRRGEGSIRELGPKFGIPKSTAEKRCATEKWQVERQEVRQKAETKAVERDVESLAAMLSKHRRVAALSLSLAAGKLAKMAELAALNPEAVDGDGLDAFTKVVARMVPVERLAAGIERIRPVKPVEVADDEEILFEIDGPDEDEATSPPAPKKAS